jgi:glycosyltransferase involved in cell wall biosynthesis
LSADAAQSTRTVLLDLTSLDTPSRHRGPGRYVRELARGLSELSPAELGGIRVIGLTYLGLGGAYRVTDDIAGFEGSAGLPAPAPKDHYHWAYARRMGLWRVVRAIDPDAVHLGDPNSTPLLMGLTHTKKIVTCHDAIPARYPSRYFGIRDGGAAVGLAIEKRRYRTADLVIAISDATRDDAVSFLGVPAERIVRVYNGVDVDRWAMEPKASAGPVLERLGLGGRAFVLYVGASDWHKNVEGMLAGFGEARKLGAEALLVWAGKLREEHAREVRATAERFGVGDAVRLLGYVSDEDLAVLFRAARAHVLVSWCEGFGLTVVEAMAAGCPVVTTRGGSLGEVVGDAALTVEPDDHAAIGSAIARLVSDGDLRAMLARRGRERAPRFSRRVQAEGMARAYAKLLGEGPA